MKPLLISLILIFSITLHSYSQTGKLDLAKESLKQQNSSSNSTASSSTKVSNNRVKNENPFLEELALFMVKVSIGFAYQIGVESHFEKEGNMHSADFSKYPYKEPYFGNYVYNDSTNNKSIFRVDIASNFVYESKNLFGNNLNINLKFARRFDLEVGSLQLFEKVNGNTDNFSLYQAMLNYHRIRTQKIDLWFGLGVNYVANDVNEAGFSYGLGSEWFLTKPISILVAFNGTTINSRPVNETRLLLKYYINNFNISTGYEYYSIGVSKINAYSFGIGASF